jgi:hypothetical protein
MPSQLFRVTRSPEAKPLNALQLTRIIMEYRTDSEWSAAEVYMQAAKIKPMPDCDVAELEVQ